MIPVAQSMVKVSTGTRDRARQLRREPTEAEKSLWHALRDRRLAGRRFRRQHPVPPCIVDFACPAARLVVEVDGGQHAGSRGDARRDAFLIGQGWKVLRFWNNDVLGNLPAVLDRIVASLEGPPPRPSPACGEGGGRTAAAASGALPRVPGEG
jgi:very-short-patch-repair endonuclease